MNQVKIACNVTLDNKDIISVDVWLEQGRIFAIDLLIKIGNNILKII